MTLLVGESPCYRGDWTRLPVTLIIAVLDAGEGALHGRRGLDIVESPLNVNGKSWLEGHHLPAFSDQPIL